MCKCGLRAPPAHRSIPASALANPSHVDVQLVFKGKRGWAEQWDNRDGKSWTVRRCGGAAAPLLNGLGHYAGNVPYWACVPTGCVS
jgi:hypothetical protein